MTLSLKALCKEYGYTLSKLSHETGITTEYLSKLNNHKQNNPTLDILNKIANTLGITILDVGNAISRESELIE